MDERLPAHLEVSALLRRVNSAGGFGVVASKGEADAGTILLVLNHNGADMRLVERMPQSDGSRCWQVSRRENMEEPGVFQEYLQRRKAQDPDLWIVELDIANAERFI